MTFLMALSPLLFVLAGILFLKKPAVKVAPLALVYTIIISFTYFNINALAFHDVVSYTDALQMHYCGRGSRKVPRSLCWNFLPSFC